MIQFICSPFCWVRTNGTWGLPILVVFFKVQAFIRLGDVNDFYDYFCLLLYCCLGNMTNFYNIALHAFMHVIIIFHLRVLITFHVWDSILLSSYSSFCCLTSVFFFFGTNKREISCYLTSVKSTQFIKILLSICNYFSLFRGRLLTGHLLELLEEECQSKRIRCKNSCY